MWHINTSDEEEGWTYDFVVDNIDGSNLLPESLNADLLSVDCKWRPRILKRSCPDVRHSQGE